MDAEATTIAARPKIPTTLTERRVEGLDHQYETRSAQVIECVEGKKRAPPIDQGTLRRDSTSIILLAGAPVNLRVPWILGS